MNHNTVQIEYEFLTAIMRWYDKNETDIRFATNCGQTLITAAYRMYNHSEGSWLRDIAQRIIQNNPTNFYYSQSADNYIAIADMATPHRKRAALKLLRQACEENNVTYPVYFTQLANSVDISLEDLGVTIDPFMRVNNLPHYRLIFDLLNSNI